MGPELYRIEPAPQALSPFVRRLMIADAGEPIALDMKPAPTGYNYIGWVFAGDTSMIIDGAETLWREDYLHAAGQIQHQDITVRYRGRFGHVLAECTAAGFYELTGVPGADVNGFAGEIPNHGAHLSRMLSDVCDGVDFPVDGDRAGPRRDAFVRFLTTLAKTPHPAPDYVRAAARLIEQADGAVKIADIIGGIDVTQRQLDRAFKEIVGVSPKYFASVLQLNKALGAMFADDQVYLTELAQAAGYYDQSHFISVMQKFFGRGPQAFLQSDVPLLATFLGKSRSV